MHTELLVNTTPQPLETHWYIVLHKFLLGANADGNLGQQGNSSFPHSDVNSRLHASMISTLESSTVDSGICSSRTPK